MNRPQFHVVPHEDEWEWVERGLLDTLIKTGELGCVVPGDFHRLLERREAFLFVSDDRTTFFILQQRKDVLTRDDLLCVLVAYSTRGRVRESILSHVEDVARDLGIDTLEMYSVRKGFIRTGWTPATTCYRRRVGYE